MAVIDFRVGQGYDVHRLVEGRSLILGGIKIDHDRGLEGHSDADVLLHAITDALFGAAGLEDIGSHFPDTDPKYKDADSRLLLGEALNIVWAKGWKPVNLDCTVIAQAPKLSPYKNQIRESIAQILHLPVNAVNVKAKTNEHLGFEGREEGLVAQAVILLRSRA